MRIPIYPASPLGFSEVGSYYYNTLFLPMLREIGFDPLDPWRLTDPQIIKAAADLPYGAEQRDAWRATNKIIGANNIQAIRKCQIVVAVLDGVDVDSGTASEIGFAAALGKPVIGYRGDFRLSADNPGSTVNLQVECFIRLNGGEIVTTIADLKSLLKQWHERLQKVP